MELTIGLTAEKTFEVTKNETAQEVGSGSLPILATPMLLAWMEDCAISIVKDALPDSQTTVGTAICLQHLKPSAVGEYLTCRAELVAMDDRKLFFMLTAHSLRGQKVASATHDRFIVDIERLMSKLK